MKRRIYQNRWKKSVDLEFFFFLKKITKKRKTNVASAIFFLFFFLVSFWKQKLYRKQSFHRRSKSQRLGLIWIRSESARCLEGSFCGIDFFFFENLKKKIPFKSFESLSMDRYWKGKKILFSFESNRIYPFESLWIILKFRKFNIFLQLSSVQKKKKRVLQLTFFFVSKEIIDFFSSLSEIFFSYKNLT